MNIDKLKANFLYLYGNTNNSIFFAPGRVNLIGEHTDYNGGFVFPCALSFGTYLLVRFNNENVVRFSTTNFDFKVDLSLDALSQKQGNEWVNYPLGVINQFIKHGIPMQGMDMLYSGNIPNGAGLSSSASIEVVTALALNDMYKAKFSMVELAKIGRAAENEFVGMNCGIMDQFAVAMGAESAAIALNCRTLEYTQVPLELGDYAIVIANTNKRRELADSKYNKRVAECASALASLRSVRNMIDLSDIEMDEFERHNYLITDPTIRKRALHVISENERVKKAIAALNNKDLVQFGQLMNQSHISLRDNYEVTGFELDTIVNEAWQMEGVLGARMTGAGFGGCSVNIVRFDKVDEFINRVGANYFEYTGLTADFYIASVGSGARKIE